jgi:hypothetical protein
LLIPDLKINPPASNTLIFPGHPSKSSRIVAGTTVFYDISNSESIYAESISFEGPTTKALVPMVNVSKTIV